MIVRLLAVADRPEWSVDHDNQLSAPLTLVRRVVHVLGNICRMRKGRASVSPSMPMAAPRAIHMACSLGRVPPRVLLSSAPAAEPATAPRKPIALDQAPAKANKPDVYQAARVIRLMKSSLSCSKVPKFSWRELLRLCRSTRAVDVSGVGNAVPQAVQQTLLEELMRVHRGHAQSSRERATSPIRRLIRYLVPLRGLF